MDKGIGYPFIRGDRGYFAEQEGIDLIEGNITQILSTIPGERVMLPEFGCKIRQVLFDDINVGTVALAKTYVIDAIKRWEKRVILLQTKCTTNADASTILVGLTYQYKATGQTYTSTFTTSKDGVVLNGKATAV